MATVTEKFFFSSIFQFRLYFFHFTSTVWLCVRARLCTFDFSFSSPTCFSVCALVSLYNTHTHTHIRRRRLATRNTGTLPTTLESQRTPLHSTASLLAYLIIFHFSNESSIGTYDAIQITTVDRSTV